MTELRCHDCGVDLWDDGGRCPALAQVIRAFFWGLENNYLDGLVCAQHMEAQHFFLERCVRRGITVGVWLQAPVAKSPVAFGHVKVRLQSDDGVYEFFSLAITHLFLRDA